jgi:hypothetical protein
MFIKTKFCMVLNWHFSKVLYKLWLCKKGKQAGFSSQHKHFKCHFFNYELFTNAFKPTIDKGSISLDTNFVQMFGISWYASLAWGEFHIPLKSSIGSSATRYLGILLWWKDWGIYQMCKMPIVNNVFLNYTTIVMLLNLDINTAK